MVTLLLALVGCTASSNTGSSANDLPASTATTSTGGHLHGWTAAGVDGPLPLPGHCHYRYSKSGEVLPDPACTPGASDPAVTTGTLRTTVCRPGGYTSQVRPPLKVSSAAKRALLAAYGVSSSQSGQYELDHFIALNSGGSSAAANLWPEPNIGGNSQSAQNRKDLVESYTFHALCAGKIGINQLQRAITSNWTTAVAVLGLPAIPTNYLG